MLKEKTHFDIVFNLVSLAGIFFYSKLMFFTSLSLFFIVSPQQRPCKLPCSLPQAKINFQAMCRGIGGKSVTCSACTIQTLHKKQMAELKSEIGLLCRDDITACVALNRKHLDDNLFGMLVPGVMPH